MRRIRRPSPALVIAVIALFMGLTGGAIGATVVPLAKRALTADKAKRATLADTATRAKTADNAAKLEGKTTAQVLAQVQIPPVTDVSGLVSTKSQNWSLSPNGSNTFTATCDSGSKATGGGYDNPNGDAIPFDSAPTGDGAGWKIVLGNLSATAPASGNVFVVCLK
jgi:hypothetical protein